ncbi:MAG: hypothetical protein KJO75_17225 [Dactylosporangium sp.]|nr:hypothetical protein [Dactylosporangium sp.]
MDTLIVDVRPDEGASATESRAWNSHREVNVGRINRIFNVSPWRPRRRDRIRITSVLTIHRPRTKTERAALDWEAELVPTVDPWC